MNQRRAAKTVRWAQKVMGHMIGEPIVAVSGFRSQGIPTTGGAASVAASLLSPVAGAAAANRRVNEISAQEIARTWQAQGATAAERLPKVALYLVATKTRLVATDSSHTTGKPSMVIAEYALSEVESMTKERSTATKRISQLSFTDGSSVLLESPRGGAYYPQDFLPPLAELLAAAHARRN